MIRTLGTLLLILEVSFVALVALDVEVQINNRIKIRKIEKEIKKTNNWRD
ncbi:hypothetical protein [Clostridium niameyense]|nr:hypothetical protein [Clostridium niameyense]